MLKEAGFTFVELVAVIAIIGLLAVLALPRMVDTNALEKQGFYDQVLAALRYAQKAAVAQNRYVCVGFPSSGRIKLTYGVTASCGSDLVGPDGQSPYVVSSSTTSFSSYTAFYFDALGRPMVGGVTSRQAIGVGGVGSIYIEAETGYVH